MTNDPTESERLRVYYAELPEEELLRIGSQYDSLTEIGQAAVRAEFGRRKLATPEAAGSLEFQNLVTIRQYRDPMEAMISKSALDSAGIFAFLRDENTVRIDWAWSNAIGGIRLQIKPEDVEAAEEILSQPFPEVIGTGNDDPNDPIMK